MGLHIAPAITITLKADSPAEAAAFAMLSRSLKRAADEIDEEGGDRLMITAAHHVLSVVSEGMEMAAEFGWIDPNARERADLDTAAEAPAS